MQRPASHRGWDPFRSRDRLAALWSAAAVPTVTSGAAAALRTLLLTLRRLVVGRTLTVRVDDAELVLAVTEFNPRLELRGLAVGQIGDIHVEARDVCWGGHRFEHAAADLRDVHLRPGMPSLMVAAPVELSLRLPAEVIESLMRRSAPGFTAELGGDGRARLRWARRPTWSHLEVDVEVVGTTLMLKPSALAIGRRRWALPDRVPAYPIGLPELPHGLVITKVGVESGSAVVHGLLPRWQIDMPLGRLEDIVQQLGAPGGLVTMSRSVRVVLP